MKEHSSEAISDEAFAKRAERWPEDTPDTKEGYFIRQIFDGMSAYQHRRSGNTHLPVDLFPSKTAAETAVRYVQSNRPQA
jgi:asparagine synthase (glutamine-hydrolysing)